MDEPKWALAYVSTSEPTLCSATGVRNSAAIIGDLPRPGESAGEGQIGMDDVHRLVVQERLEAAHHFQLSRR